jgi:HAD superfamily hydrolase (TIGR01549 family)
VSALLVTFDGDDTLWPFGPTIDGALDDSLRSLDRYFPDHAVTVEHLYDDRVEVRRRLPEGSDLRDYRRAAFQHRVDLLGGGPDTLVDELCDRFIELRSTLIEPYPDAVPALDRLADRAVLGLISNGDADLDRTSLARHFAFRLHAWEHGPEKPGVELFELALERTGLSREVAVHVGDSLECDVAGAHAAGWKAVWLNRDGASNTTGLRPDAEIATLAELDTALAVLVP